jgi:hypothetical protein
MRSSKTFAFGALALAALIAGCKPPATNTASNAAAANVATAAAVNTASNATLSAAGGSDAADAKAFLDGLYAHYLTSNNNTFQMFDANVAEVFDADTIALLKADAKGNHGEVGAIDGDWLCNCQDFTRIVATVTVQSATPNSATAIADYSDSGEPNSPKQEDSFDLVKVNGAWRIHDMTIKGQGPSLRTTLQKEIASFGPGGRNERAIDDAD